MAREDAHALSQLLHAHSRWSIATVAALVHASVYLVANHFLVARPVELPLTLLDRWIPFLPQFIWVYWSDYLLVFAAFLLCPQERLVRFTSGFMVVLGVSATVHLLFPVVYPRGAYPLDPAAAVDLSGRMVALLRQADSPASCFPSLHVGLAVFATAVVGHGHARLERPLAGWAALIMLSTLTLKQHYVLDVVSGACLGWWVSRAPLEHLMEGLDKLSPGGRAGTG